jgi:hypothetical protein
MTILFFKAFVLPTSYFPVNNFFDLPLTLIRMAGVVYDFQDFEDV